MNPTVFVLTIIAVNDRMDTSTKVFASREKVNNYMREQGFTLRFNCSDTWEARKDEDDEMSAQVCEMPVL